MYFSALVSRLGNLHSLFSTESLSEIPEVHLWMRQVYDIVDWDESQIEGPIEKKLKLSKSCLPPNSLSPPLLFLP